MATQKARLIRAGHRHARVYSLGVLVFRPSIAAWLVIHGEQIIKEPQFADYSGSILSGPELGGVSKIRMIFRCGTEITTILSLS